MPPNALSAHLFFGTLCTALRCTGFVQPAEFLVLFRVHGLGAWVRTAKSSGREYVSLTLADPMIGPRKIYANLAPVKDKDGRHVILWNPQG